MVGIGGAGMSVSPKSFSATSSFWARTRSKAQSSHYLKNLDKGASKHEAERRGAPASSVYSSAVKMDNSKSQ